MLAVVILEIVFIIFKIKFNLADYLGTNGKYVAGYWVPLGELKVIFHVILTNQKGLQSG